MRPDVIVVGGGPAGASSAIRLASRGRRIRLYEKSRFPRTKLCGGFLSAEACQSLDELGVLDEIRRAGAVPIRRSVIASRRGTMAESVLQKEGLSTSRDIMDLILLDRARTQGVDVREEDGFSALHDAAVAVVASGRQSVLREPSAAPPWPWYARSRENLYGLQAIFENVAGMTDQVELDLVEHGYVGLARQQRHQVNVCALTTQTEIQKWGPSPDDVMKHFADQNKILKEHLKPAHRVGAWSAVGPVRLGVRRLTQGHTFYVGDAACVVDPFAGEGMSIGLYASKLLVQALDQRRSSPAEAYIRYWKEAFLPALRWNAAMRLAASLTFLHEPVLRGFVNFPSGLRHVTDLTRHRFVKSVER